MRPRRIYSFPLASRSGAGRWKQQAWITLIFPLLLIVAGLQWRWISETKGTFFRLRGSWYTEYLACDLCGKTGFISSSTNPWMRVMCPVCQGRGGAYIRRLDAQDVICPACGGMGRIYDEPDAAHFCERCGGRGLIRAEEEPEASPHAP